MGAMRTWTARSWVAAAALAAGLAMAGRAAAQDEGPVSNLHFVVVKDFNGKPVKNAAVVMHPVNGKGKQERGGMELKTDPEGKTGFDGIPYGVLRVQVLAQGFQTYGQDFEINKPEMEIVVKLKRPQGQYSVYEDHPDDKKPDDKKPEDKKDETKPPNQKPQ